MKCPKCEKRTSVKDSRQGPGASWRRRRSCFTCGHRFTTREIEGDFIHNLILENKTLRKKTQVFEKALGIDQHSLEAEVREEVNAG